MYVILAPRPSMFAAAAGLRTAPDVVIEPETTALVIGAESRRAAVALQNLGVHELRVGDADAGPERGAKVSGGEAITLLTSADVHAYNPGPLQISLSVLYLEL